MPTASNLLCDCGRFMRVKQNSVTIEEVMDDGAPYRLWDADLYECAECGREVVSGFASLPLAEHWQPNYAELRARLAQLSPILEGRCR
jgi:hypothetical protein